MIEDRIKKCKCPKKGRMDYLKSQQMGDDCDEVVCKLCGTKILNKGKPNNLYQEITIEFEDRSAHETSICKSCAQNPIDQDQLEFIYMSDINQWKRELNIDYEHMNKEIKSYKVGSRYM